MTKAELMKSLREATGLTAASTEEFFERLCDIVAAELLGGGEVSLPRVGKLTVKGRAARKGRNPRTGERMDIPAGKKLVLIACKEMKDSLR